MSDKLEKACPCKAAEELSLDELDNIAGGYELKNKIGGAIYAKKDDSADGNEFRTDYVEMIP